MTQMLRQILRRMSGDDRLASGREETPDEVRAILSAFALEELYEIRRRQMRAILMEAEQHED